MDLFQVAYTHSSQANDGIVQRTAPINVPMRLRSRNHGPAARCEVPQDAQSVVQTDRFVISCKRCLHVSGISPSYPCALHHVQRVRQDAHKTMARLLLSKFIYTVRVPTYHPLPCAVQCFQPSVRFNLSTDAPHIRFYCGSSVNFSREWTLGVFGSFQRHQPAPGYCNRSIGKTSAFPIRPPRRSHLRLR